MFDELIRETRRLEAGIKIPLSISLDSDGCADRKCPKPECQFVFKVEWNAWSERAAGHAVYCPSCGHTADSGSWNTPEQWEYFKSSALSAFGQRIGQAMERDAARWNRQQVPDALVRMTLSVDTPRRSVLLPPEAAEAIQIKLACSECSCRYAVIGAAFFCPACGHNDVDRVFGEALDNASRTLEAIPTIQGTLPSRETAETTSRSLTEHALLSAVTAFQKYAEHLYARLSVGSRPRRNTFQNIDEGSKAWKAVAGVSYERHLEPKELTVLRRGFQQRHLIAHTQGVVDDDYVARSGDTSWRVGQRLVLRVEAVQHYVSIIKKLALAMATDATYQMTRSHGEKTHAP